MEKFIYCKSYECKLFEKSCAKRYYLTYKYDKCGIRHESHKEPFIYYFNLCVGCEKGKELLSIYKNEIENNFMKIKLSHNKKRVFCRMW